MNLENMNEHHALRHAKRAVELLNDVPKRGSGFGMQAELSESKPTAEPTESDKAGVKQFVDAAHRRREVTQALLSGQARIRPTVCRATGKVKYVILGSDEYARKAGDGWTYFDLDFSLLLGERLDKRHDVFALNVLGKYYEDLQIFDSTKGCSICKERDPMSCKMISGACECNCRFHPFCFLKWLLEQWEKRDWPHVERRKGVVCEVCSLGNRLKQPKKITHVSITLQAGLKKFQAEVIPTSDLSTRTHRYILTARARYKDRDLWTIVSDVQIADPPPEIANTRDNSTITKVDNKGKRLYWNGSVELGGEGWGEVPTRQPKTWTTHVNQGYMDLQSNEDANSKRSTILLQNPPAEQFSLWFEILFVDAFHAKMKRTNPRTFASQAELDKEEEDFQSWRREEPRVPAVMQRLIRFP